MLLFTAFSSTSIEKKELKAWFCSYLYFYIMLIFTMSITLDETLSSAESVAYSTSNTLFLIILSLASIGWSITRWEINILFQLSLIIFDLASSVITFREMRTLLIIFGTYFMFDLSRSFCTTEKDCSAFIMVGFFFLHLYVSNLDFLYKSLFII